MEDSTEYLSKPPLPAPEKSPQNEALTVFNEAYAIYEGLISPLLKKAEDRPNELTAKEKRQLADFFICRQGKRKIIDQGEPYIEVRTEKGVVQEGIPVEGMIEVLEEEIKRLENQLINLPLSERNTEGNNLVVRINELTQLKEKILKHCLTFGEARARQGLTPDQIAARVKAEAYIISQDKLRRSTNPDNQKRMEEDYRKAKKTLKRRLEFFLPPSEGGQSPEQQPTSVQQQPPEEGIEEHTATVSQTAVASEQLSPASPIRGLAATEASAEFPSERHNPPFIVDDPNNLVDRLTFEEVKKAAGQPQEGESQKIAQLRERMNTIKTFLADPETQAVLSQHLPRGVGESDQDYQRRVLRELEKRVTFLGDYEEKDDPLSTLLSKKGLRGETITPRLLQAVEAMRWLLVDEQNQKRLALWEEAQKQGRWVLPLGIDFGRGVVDVFGAMPVFDETGKRSEMARRDMHAALLLTNAFAHLDYETITDPITGQRRVISFSDKIEAFLQQIKEAKTEEQKEAFAQRIQEERQSYLKRLQEVLKKREWQTNPFSESQLFERAAYDLLQQLRPPFDEDKFNQLLEFYKNNPLIARLPSHMRESTERRLRETFSKEGVRGDFLGYAQKGIDLLERRMELLSIPKPELEEIPQVIYAKVWKQGGEYQRHEPPAGGVVTAAETVVAPPEPEQQPSEGGSEEPAPAVPPEERAVVPAEEQPPEGEQLLEEQPTSVEKQPPEGEKPPEGRQLPQPEKPLVTEFNLGFAADPRQITYEAQAGVDFQMQLHQREQKGPLRAFLGSFWQRGVLGPVFRAREENWRRKTLAAINQHHLPNEVVERAMEVGKERLRQKKFPQKVGAFFRNLVSGLSGLIETAQQQEARRWLVEEVNKVRMRESADETVKRFIEASQEEKSAFASRVSLPDERFALHQGERRELIEDPAIKQTLMDDFFTLVLDYINGQITDDQLRARIDSYCSPQGVTVGGQTLSLSSRLGDRYPALTSRLTLVGSNMFQIAKTLREQKDSYQQKGIITDPSRKESWLGALTSQDEEKRLKFNIFVAEAEISPGWKSPRERALRLLSERNERYPGVLGNGSLKEATGLLGRLAMSLGLNEISAAVAGSYAGSLLTTFLPWNPAGRQAVHFAQIAGISVPLVVVSSTVGAPVLIPVAAGSLAAGAVAAIREAVRLRQERKAIEREASFSIGLDPQDPRVNLGLLGKVARFVYGGTSRAEMLGHIVHQREASLLLKGLTVESGLFADPTNLTSELPANISAENVKKALRWLAETSVRLDATYRENRRFIRYSSQLSEAQQHALLAGALMEVYERLNQLFAQREDLRKQFLPSGESFDQLYDRLKAIFYHNLVGERQPLDERTQQALAVLGEEGTKGLIAENESKRKRDQAFRGLMLRKTLHRGIGVTATSFAIGQALQEANYQIQTRISGHDAQPSLIGHLLGEGRKIETLAPGSDVIDYNNIHLRLPKGFRYDQTTHELISPTGRKIDLDDYFKDGQLDIERLNQAGLNIEGTSTVTEKVAGNLMIVDSDGNGMIDQVVINGHKITLSHQIDPTNPESLKKLYHVLQQNGVSPDSFKSIHQAIGGFQEKTAPLWDKLAVPIKKRQWYAYDKPGSQGNELKLHNYYKQVGTNASGEPVYGVRLDMSKMGLGYQTGLQPNPVNVQEVIKNGKAGFSFVLPDGRTAFIPEGVDGRLDGQLFLNPLDTEHYITLSDGSRITLGELARMVINQDNLRRHISNAGLGPSGPLASEYRHWQDVFNVSYIEAASAPSDGVLSVFATIRGSGQLPSSISRFLIKVPVPVLRKRDVINLGEVRRVDTGFAVPIVSHGYSRYAEVGRQPSQPYQSPVTVVPVGRRQPNKKEEEEVKPASGESADKEVGVKEEAGPIPTGVSPTQPSQPAQPSQPPASPPAAVAPVGGQKPKEEEEEVESAADEQASDKEVAAAEAVVELNGKRESEIVGRSGVGGRENDEDSYFDGKEFCFQKLSNEILQIMGKNGLSPEDVLDIYKKKKNKGLIGSIAIVADGMGGQSSGEIASAVVTVAFVKKLCDKLSEDGTINENLLKTALQEAMALFTKIAQESGINLDSGTTFVAQVTDKNGNVFVINVGDSRAYRIDENGQVSLITADQSIVWSLAKWSLIDPTEIFTHPQRGMVYGAIQAESSTQLQPQVYQLGQLKKGEKLILVCDGVWEDIDPNASENQKIFSEALTQSARLIGDKKIRAVMAYIFQNLNLEALSDLSKATINEILDQLMKNNGQFSKDNVTAVVIGY